jgi:hypothetical protein
MLNALVFYSSVNTKGKRDATGAFHPAALAFAKRHGIPRQQVVPVACERMTKKERRETVLAIMGQYCGADLEAVAFFCHGWPTGFQMGFNRSNVAVLAKAIRNCSNELPVVPLYCCSTAENDEKDNYITEVGIGTDGGFADLLRDNLCRLGISAGWVDAHKTAGHSTRNPFAVRFRMSDVEDRLVGGVGGDWVVCPGSSVWSRWKEYLRDESSPLRYDFPFLTTLSIKYILEAGSVYEVK